MFGILLILIWQKKKKELSHPINTYAEVRRLYADKNHKIATRVRYTAAWTRR